MPNPGIFKGARKAFLTSQKTAYKIAREENHVAETLTDIYRRFFKRFPIDQAEEWEPTEEQLAAVDDNEADEEREEPDSNKMSPEEYQLAIKLQSKRQAAYAVRQGKIARWLKYQYKADQKAAKKTSASTSNKPDLYAQLLQRLLGKDPVRPRLKTPMNMWRKERENHDAIEAELKNMHPEVPTKDLMKTRDQIARKLFSELSAAEKRKWTQAAADEHSAAMERFHSEIEVDGNLPLEDIQCAIEGIGNFMLPIMDALCKITGWKATFVAGGPEPANGGQLNTVSVHSGFTSGDTKMHFGRAERFRYKKIFLPIFGDFLRKCYTAAECKQRALPMDSGYEPMQVDDDAMDATGNIQTMHPLPTRKETASSVEGLNVAPKIPQTRSSEKASNNNLPSGDEDFNPFPDTLTFSDESGSEDGQDATLHQAPSPEAVHSPPASPPMSPRAQTPINESAGSPQATRLKTPTAVPPTTDPGNMRPIYKTAKPQKTVGSKAHSQPNIPLPATQQSTQETHPVLAPRSAHPSIAITQSSTPNASSTASMVSTETPAAKKSSKRKGENKIQSGGPPKKKKGSRKNNITEPDVQGNDPVAEPSKTATVGEPNGNRRVTRSKATPTTSQVKAPAGPTVEEVLTRTGKPAKKSRFWSYVEED